jgi:hypothetical protein
VSGLAALAISGDDRWNPPARAAERELVGPPKELAEPKLVLWSPNDGVAAALADALTVPEYDRPFMRYLFIPNGDMRTVRSLSLTLGFISRASLPYLPTPLANNHLVRFDIRRLAPRDEDIVEWLRFLEEFAFDTSFNLDLTRDALEFAAKFDVQIPTKKVERKVTRKVREKGPDRKETVEVRVNDPRGEQYKYKDDSGREPVLLKPGVWTVTLRFNTETEREVSETIVEEVPALLVDGVDVLRFNSRGINPDTLSRLQLLTSTEAPIIHSRYFLSRALSTIQTSDATKAKGQRDGVFETAFGGKYYQFRLGIDNIRKKAKQTKTTEQDVFFADVLFVGNIKGQLNAKQVFERARSDRRSLILNSDVTAKHRCVVDIPTLAELEGGMFTLDPKDENVDLKFDPLADLEDPEFDALEGIFNGANGLPITVAINGQGVFQDEVPFNVANDTTIPHPHTQRLQPLISCLRCHAGDGGDFWKPLHNDADELIGLRPGQVDVFGDLTDRRRAFTPDRIDRIAGQYRGGDQRTHLRRLREDYMTAVLIHVGGSFEGSDGSQADVGVLSARHIAALYARERFAAVGAKEALEDVGLEEGTHYPGGKLPDATGKMIDSSVATFQAVVPPDLRNRLGDFYLEDPRIAVLRSGGKLPWAQWFFARPFVAERSVQKVEAIRAAVREKQGAVK